MVNRQVLETHTHTYPIKIQVNGLRHTAVSHYKHKQLEQMVDKLN